MLHPRKATTQTEVQASVNVQTAAELEKAKARSMHDGILIATFQTQSQAV